MVEKIYADELLFIPDSVYGTLPARLRESCASFNDKAVRDMYLLSQLSFLSACFPYVYGVYDQATQHLNLNLVILAKAARGKSVTEFAAEAIQGIAAEFNKRVGKGDQNEFRPSFIFPANTSSAALVSQLNTNSGMGICYETELDTMNKSMSAVWSDISDIIRCSFHGEAISQLRRKNQESITIPNPKLSFVFTGTPKQIEGFIMSPENGMFSRFMYYKAMVKPKFRDCRPSTDRPNLTPYFKGLSHYFTELYIHFRDKNVYINLSEDHWDDHHSTWENEFGTVIDTDEDFASVVTRYALMHFRLAMLLTVLRIGTSKISDTLSYTCIYEDYKAARDIALVIMRHAYLVYKSLPNCDSTGVKGYLIEFLNMLPKGVELKRKEIIAFWKMEDKESTADYRIKTLMKANLLESAGYGTFIVPIGNS